VTYMSFAVEKVIIFILPILIILSFGTFIVHSFRLRVKKSIFIFISLFLINIIGIFIFVDKGNLEIGKKLFWFLNYIFLVFIPISSYYFYKFRGYFNLNILNFLFIFILLNSLIYLYGWLSIIKNVLLIFNYFIIYFLIMDFLLYYNINQRLNIKRKVES